MALVGCKGILTDQAVHDRPQRAYRGLADELSRAQYTVPELLVRCLHGSDLCVRYVLITSTVDLGRPPSPRNAALLLLRAAIEAIGRTAARPNWVGRRRRGDGARQRKERCFAYRQLGRLACGLRNLTGFFGVWRPVMSGARNLAGRPAWR